MEKHRTEYALLKMGIKFTIGEILFKKKKKKSATNTFRPCAIQRNIEKKSTGFF